MAYEGEASWPGGGPTTSSIAAVAVDLGAAVLLVGFAIAGVEDLRRREVSDRLWQAMGLLGFAIGLAALSPGGAVPLVAWSVVALLTLEHLVGWDLWLGPKWERHADRIELAGYAGALLIVIALGARYGIGSNGLPWAAVAAMAVVLLARGLFELRVLYGAADAKALMIAAVLLPVFPTPWLYSPTTATSALAYLPFPISLLTNAALFSLVVPIYLALRNAGRGEFSLGDGFTGYSLPVRELPDRFVWVRDPAVPETGHADAETTEEDTELRRRIARDLEGKGIDRVWVTPQVPLVAVMAAGAVAALLAGNVLLDLMLRI